MGKEYSPLIYGLHIHLCILHNQDCCPDLNTQPSLASLQVLQTDIIQCELGNTNEPIVFQYSSKWHEDNSILVLSLMSVEVLAPCNDVKMILWTFFVACSHMTCGVRDQWMKGYARHGIGSRLGIQWIIRTHQVWCCKCGMHGVRTCKHCRGRGRLSGSGPTGPTTVFSFVLGCILS
jgi:hypothetical protein